jgi:hypothetical protein
MYTVRDSLFWMSGKNCTEISEFLKNAGPKFVLPNSGTPSILTQRDAGREREDEEDEEDEDETDLVWERAA